MQHMILIRVFLVIFLSDDSFCFPPALETTLALVLPILTGLVSALISVNLINSDGFFGGYNLPGGGGRNFKIRRQRCDGIGLPTSIAWISVASSSVDSGTAWTLSGFKYCFLPWGCHRPAPCWHCHLWTPCPGWNQDYPYSCPNQKPS